MYSCGQLLEPNRRIRTRAMDGRQTDHQTTQRGAQPRVLIEATQERRSELAVGAVELDQDWVEASVGGEGVVRPGRWPG